MINIRKKILSSCTQLCFSTGKKIPTIQQVQKEWSNYSKGYSSFDYGPQTLFYSLLYNTQTWAADNILEVACGTGKFIPFAMQMKKPQANYLAVDLSPQMVKLADEHTKHNFSLYDSKLSYQEWLKKMNLQFRVANAEEPMELPNNKKFDRILCNCVLMLTASPQKMMRNLHSMADEGCLMGVSVWGAKQKNNYLMAKRDTILELGLELPEERSNFHLYNKLQGLAEKTGWEVVQSWQQNSLFPVLEADADKYGALLYYQIEKLPEKDQEAAKKLILGKVDQILKKKEGLNFSCKMLILRKK